MNCVRLIADDSTRLTSKYGQSSLDCENLIAFMVLGLDNVCALTRTDEFPVSKVGNRQVVSILAFVAWQVGSLPEAV